MGVLGLGEMTCISCTASSRLHQLCLLAATWKGRAVAVKVMLASHGEHASELESFRQEVRLLCCGHPCHAPM